MEREVMEAQLEQLKQQYGQVEARRNATAQELTRLNESLLRLNGGIGAIGSLLIQEAKGTDGVPSDAPEEGGGAE